MKKSIFVILIAYFCLEVYAALSPSQEAWLSVTDTEPAVADTTGYLIVSTPKYREPIKKFMEWKRTLGFQVDTLLLISNPLTNTQVWDSIQNRYNQNHHLAYLLIVGNCNDIPSFRDSVYLNSEKFDTDYHSGWYRHYTDFSYGLCSNSNEYNLPLLKRGRILVDSINEACVVINKISSYEKSPPNDVGFYNTGLHIAQYQDRNPFDWHEDYRFTLTSEEIRNFMLSNGKVVKRIYTGGNYPNSKILYWNNTFYGNGGIVPDNTRVVMRQGSSTQMVIDSINNGVFYTLYYDHGSQTEWINPSFSNYDINSLNNGNKLPLVISCCCHTGALNNSNCFAGSFLKKEGGGCIGVIASSNIIMTGFTDILLEGMFSCMWTGNAISIDSIGYTALNTISESDRHVAYRLGDILDESLRTVFLQTDNLVLHGFSDDATEEEMDNFRRYTCQIFHLFGDPAMELYTDVPQVFTTPVIDVTSSCVHVATTDGEARISFYNQTTGTVNSYVGASVDYPHNGGNTLRMSITRHNYIPYLIDIEIGGDIYIQNESVQNNRTYRGGNIYVGNSVNQDEQQGEVVFESGSNTILKGGAVKLDKETRIEKGARVSIN